MQTWIKWVIGLIVLLAIFIGVVAYFGNFSGEETMESSCKTLCKMGDLGNFTGNPTQMKVVGMNICVCSLGDLVFNYSA